jgi:hypothetical protein
MLPSAVQPPVLGGVFSYELFDCLGVFGCNPPERVILVGPLFGEDDAGYSHLKVKTVINSSAVAYTYRHITTYRKQPYAFVSARLSAEKIHKYSFFAGVLVGNKTQRRSS